MPKYPQLPRSVYSTKYRVPLIPPKMEVSVPSNAGKCYQPLKNKTTDTAKTLGFYWTEDRFWPDFDDIKHDYTQEFYRSYSSFINVRGPVSFAVSETNSPLKQLKWSYPFEASYILHLSWLQCQQKCGSYQCGIAYTESWRYSCWIMWRPITVCYQL